MTTRHLIVGTAGHIDHGKSALVEALTGVHPDRLKEEKVRGITIELGFADLDLGGGRVLSFIDVPGHERFVRHMVAGVTGIDAVLLVVAADDGVCPQSREHLEICKLLEVPNGLVVLSKSDLVDAELREVVALEVRDFVRGSFLERSPIVAVSAKTGAGLEELRASLAALFDSVAPRSTTGIARLPVDRSFVQRGFGTVVTGTLVSGRLREGDDVEILPGSLRARVRGLQVHRHQVGEAIAGQRTAVNLQGRNRDEVPRGSTVTHPGGIRTTRRVWATIRLLESAPRDLSKGGRVRFHQGTCERGARLRILGPNARGVLAAEIRLDSETVLLPGDRFILRRPAPVDTVGGGVVVDVRPPRGRRPTPGAVDLAGASTLGDAIVVRVARAGASGRWPHDLAAELGLSPDELSRELERLASQGRIVSAAGLVVGCEAWEALSGDVETVLAAYHRDNPLRPGMSREELRARVCRAMPPEAWRLWLERAGAAERLRLEGDRVALAGHRVVLSVGDQELVKRIGARILAGGLDPPPLAEVLGPDSGERAERIVELMIAAGDLVRLSDGRTFHGQALRELRSKLREYAKTSSRIDVGTFKELARVTRKNAIPLLEHLDAERVTRRVGNVREILNV